jgi:polar amino acid transport system substrate-binding protein
MRHFFTARLRSIASLTMAVAAVAAASLVPTAQTPQLRLVSTAWSPFTNRTGEPRFALDLVETALRRINITAITAIVDAADFTPALLTGPFDGSGAAWKDAERENLLLFSQPYLENRLVLVGRKGADVGATTLTALAGKKIALVGGYAYGDIDKTGPVFVRTQSEEDSLTQLLQSKADYALMDDLVVQYIVSNYPRESQSRLQLGTAAVVVRPLYFTVRRSRPDAESIVSRFNAQLRGLIADRTYHKLLHVGWIRADVDGDGVAEYVPASDKAGTSAPQSAYLLSTTDASKNMIRVLPVNQRFYVGGTIYPDWAAVPNRYKVEDPLAPSPGRSTASIFKFVW